MGSRFSSKKFAAKQILLVSVGKRVRKKTDERNINYLKLVVGVAQIFYLLEHVISFTNLAGSID